MAQEEKRAERLHELKSQNSRLQQLVAELLIKNQRLREAQVTATVMLRAAIRNEPVDV